MSVSGAVPKILAHVDVERWGPRKAELLTLIAAFQGDGPNPVPLGRRTLMALGRSARQAKYDHEEVLMGLAADQVLMRWRGTGTRPDAWAVAELARWRNVPFKIRRREVLKRFSRPLPDAAVSLWPDGAGQVGSRGQAGTGVHPLERTGSSVSDPATPTRHPATSAQPERESERSPGLNGTVERRPSPIGFESEFTPSLTPLGKTEGGRECADASDPGTELLRAVQAVAKTPVFGVQADRIRDVGRRHAEHLEQLLHFAGMLTWVKTASGAAAAVENHAAELRSTPSRDPRISQANQRAYLERMLAIEERDGGDFEVIEDLKSQLASLGGA